jgi:hypothetical protein
MWYTVHISGNTVTIHDDECGQRPRVPTYPCGCTDVSPGGHHRTWCSEHVTPAAITRLLSGPSKKFLHMCMMCSIHGIVSQGEPV